MGRESADPEKQDLCSGPRGFLFLLGPKQSQRNEIHGLEEGEGKQEQQHPRSVLNQQAYAATLDQLVCGERRGARRRGDQDSGRQRQCQVLAV